MAVHLFQDNSRSSKTSPDYRKLSTLLVKSAPFIFAWPIAVCARPLPAPAPQLRPEISSRQRRSAFTRRCSLWASLPTTRHGLPAILLLMPTAPLVR